MSGYRKRPLFRAVVSALLAPGLLGVSAPAFAGGGDADQMTNVELAEESIRGAVVAALATFPQGHGAARVVPLGKSDVNSLVEAILVEEMSARGFAVEVPPSGEADVIAQAVGESDTSAVDDPAAAGDARGALLFFRVKDFTFRYADIYRRFVFGPKRVRRLSRVELHLRLTDAGGQAIVWSENGSHSAADIVPYGLVDALESKSYAFAKPEREPGTLARLYEPLIVAGIVGGLVFLFYSNQSGE